MTSPLFSSANKLKLGTFSANCSGGMAVTKVEERWDNNWDNNIDLVQQCDEAGIEFMLPIARWIGYEGDTDFHGNVLETVTWAAGLAAHSSRSPGLCHGTYRLQPSDRDGQATGHPGQLSGGHIGLNVVAGWNKPEYDAFGKDLPGDHADRYAMAQSGSTTCKSCGAWIKPLTGRVRSTRAKESTACPIRSQDRIPIINAAASEEGRNFAMRNADFLFTPVFDFEQARDTVQDISTRAASVNRQVDVLTFCTVVCRPTQQEAEDYLNWYADENADWEAVDNLMTLQGLHAQSFTLKMGMFRDRFAAGHGGFPMVGTPDTIADLLEQLSATGVAGTTLAFVDYAKEFPYFRQEVLPELERKGLRQPFQHS